MNILVTGGTRGYGKELADKLREEHNVYTLSRIPIDIDDEKWIRGDLENEASFVIAIREFVSWDIKLDAIIHGASCKDPYRGDHLGLHIMDIKKSLAINATSPYFLTKLALEFDVLKKDGTVIFFDNKHSENERYHISKALIPELRCLLDKDYKGLNVRCVSEETGLLETVLTFLRLNNEPV